jgi:hypothetical protein
MPAIGMIVGWLGWSVASWGYCLVRGYDVKFTDWINPVHPYQGWPPPQAPADQIIPGQNPGAAPKGSKASPADVAGAGISSGLTQAGL